MNRLYHNYFLPDKSEEYRQLLIFLKKNGYEFHTVRSFEEVNKDDSSWREPENNWEARYCILRRDVDTQNKKVLAEMLDIEKETGARCSYYFRLRTIDVPFMKKIEQAGGEASYHYEEIASCAIRNRIKRREEMYSYIDACRMNFVKNLNHIREESGLACVTVASHGEWINRKLGISNTEIMTGEIRLKCGIVRETYDEEAMRYVNARFADQDNDEFVNKIFDVVGRDRPRIIYILTHPAQWRADFIGSIKLDSRRIIDEIYWHLKRKNREI